MEIIPEKVLYLDETELRVIPAMYDRLIPPPDPKDRVVLTRERPWYYTRRAPGVRRPIQSSGVARNALFDFQTTPHLRNYIYWRDVMVGNIIWIRNGSHQTAGLVMIREWLDNYLATLASIGQAKMDAKYGHPGRHVEDAHWYVDMLDDYRTMGAIIATKKTPKDCDDLDLLFDTEIERAMSTGDLHEIQRARVIGYAAKFSNLNFRLAPASEIRADAFMTDDGPGGFPLVRRQLISLSEVNMAAPLASMTIEQVRATREPVVIFSYAGGLWAQANDKATPLLPFIDILRGRVGEEEKEMMPAAALALFHEAALLGHAKAMVICAEYTHRSIEGRGRLDPEWYHMMADFLFTEFETMLKTDCGFKDYPIKIGAERLLDEMIARVDLRGYVSVEDHEFLVNVLSPIFSDPRWPWIGNAYKHDMYFTRDNAELRALYSAWIDRVAPLDGMCKALARTAMEAWASCAIRMGTVQVVPDIRKKISRLLWTERARVFTTSEMASYLAEGAVPACFSSSLAAAAIEPEMKRAKN